MKWSDIFLADGRLSPVLMLWAFYIAVVMCAIIYYSITAKLGKIVSKLLQAGATSPESAANIENAQIKPNFFTKICLKSPMNYKNLLVAITPDGKFYANTQYTDEPPKFKPLTAITRKKRSRINEKNDRDCDEITGESVAREEVSSSSVANQDVAYSEKSIMQNPKIITNSEENDIALPYISHAKPTRVTFNPFTAKYYIPKEVHVRANGIFKNSKTSAILVISALIGLGVIIFFAGYIIDGLIASASNFFK